MNGPLRASAGVQSRPINQKSPSIKDSVTHQSNAKFVRLRGQPKYRVGQEDTSANNPVPKLRLHLSSPARWQDVHQL
jgi:hypothetical protein